MSAFGLTRYLPEQAYQGYTLFTPTAGTSTYLIDMQGKIVQRWELPGRPGTYGYLLDNGHLLVNIRTGSEPLAFGGRSSFIRELDWHGAVVWEYADDSLHHDFCRMANGHTMVLGWEPVPRDMVPHIQGGLPGTEHAQGIWSDYFREITPDHRVVWEWHAYEHLDVGTDVIGPLYRRQEWTHANACDVLPNGDILTSFRMINTVAIIDRASGHFGWKWGHDELGGQHDPTLLPNGHVLIFDNGYHARNGLPAPRSRVIEVDPTTNAIVWSYATRPGWNFFSAFISGAQRLPNGNTLICEGMTGRLFEVTAEGEVVWQYVNPFFADDERFGRINNVFRAYRYGPEFPGLQGQTPAPDAHAWFNHLYAAQVK